VSAHIVAADSITGLVGAAVYAETLAAVSKHLRHEREFVEATILVERSEDFLLAPDLYPVASTRFHINILSSPERGPFELLAQADFVMVNVFVWPFSERAGATNSLHTRLMSLMNPRSKKAR
jgi:hypothetical protein